MKKIALCLAMVALALTACDNSKELVISPSNVTLHASEMQQLEVVGENADFVDWQVADAFVAKVTAKGVIVANHVGTTTILAKVGEKEGTCAVTVEPKYHTYIEPITKWGMTMSEVIAEKGKPTEQENGYLEYTQGQNGISEIYTFDDNNRLHASLITMEHDDYAYEFLEERYFMQKREDGALFYIDALTVADATKGILYDTTETGEAVITYLPISEYSKL